MNLETIKALAEFSDVIDTYGGRDKVMKALCYSAKMMAGYKGKNNPDLAKRYAIASSKISGARATLRLIDDFPALYACLSYGYGRHEKDKVVAFLNVAANLVDLLFCPIETLSWLADNKIISVGDADKLDFINSAFWVVSVYLNLMKNLRTFSQNQQKINSMNTSKTAEQEKSLKKHRIELLTLVRLTLDFTHAVSTLPKGYLWGGKLSTFQVGCIGTTSAAIGIYQIFAKRKLNK